MTKRREIEKIAKEMKFKYEYDSDEETDKKTGTWEHTLRKAEMEATKGSHFIYFFFSICPFSKRLQF